MSKIRELKTEAQKYIFFLIPKLGTGNRDRSKTSKESIHSLLYAKDICSLVYDDFRRELNLHLVIYNERVQLFLSTKKN